MASILTGRGGTLVKLGLTEVASEARLAGTGEGVLTIDALATVARRGLAIVDICLAVRAYRMKTEILLINKKCAFYI